MTAKTRSQLRSVFANGVTASAQDFTDLADSFAALLDDNTIQGGLTIAGAVDVSSNCSFNDGIFSAALNANAGIEVSGSATFSGIFSYGVDISASAQGNSQATAYELIRPVTVVTDVVSGQGVKPPESSQGAEWIIFNRTNSLLKIYPSSGAMIDDTTELAVSGKRSAKITYTSPTRAYSMLGQTAGALSPIASLLVSASSSSRLVMNDSNWPTYNKAKFAFAGAIYPFNDIGTKNFYYKAGNDFEWGLGLVLNRFNIQLNTTQALGQTFETTAVVSALKWNAYLVHIDLSAATTADRCKLWINRSERTNAAPGSFSAGGNIVSASSNVGIFARSNGSNPFTGYIYQPTFFSSVLPTTAQVFNGSAGKLHDLSTIDGAISLLDAQSVTFDKFIPAAWSVCGAVEVSNFIP